MPQRTLNLPKDFALFSTLIPATFEYPENKDWNVRSDELDMLVDMAKNMQRFWPLIRLGQLFSPNLRKILPGIVWEEDGKPVGILNYQQRGSTKTWVITNLGVLPTYRRRGIARKLMELGIEAIRQEGAEIIILDVIADNVPAYRLYEKLGFEHFSGHVQLNFDEGPVPEVLPLPDNYQKTPLDFFDWETRFALEKRLISVNVEKYEPVEAARFRQPSYLRLLLPLIFRAIGIQDNEFAFRTAADSQVIGRARQETRTRSGGVNSISVRLDPVHADLAPYLVKDLLQKTLTQSPGRRIVFDVPQWQEAVLQAAHSAGFEKRHEFHRMGLALQSPA